MNLYLRNSVVLLMILLASVRISFSQEKEWRPAYMNISVNDGLPSSETYFVHQDSHGYMWFCTDHGVVKYDGFRLHLYTKSSGLPDDVVFKIYEDEVGRVWFYLYNGTLAFYDHETRKMVPYKYNHLLKQVNHGDFNIRKSFVVDKDGSVIYSGNYSLARIDKYGRLTRHESKSSKESVNVGKEWLPAGMNNPGARKELEIKFTPEKGKPFYYNYGAEISKYEALQIKKRLFLFVNSSIFDYYDPSRKVEFVDYTGMCQVDGELWITTLTGAYRFKNPENADLTKPDGVYLKDQKISSVTKDSEGGYWFSTLDKGVFYTPCLEITSRIPEEKEQKGAIQDIKGIGTDVYYTSFFGYYNLKNGECLLAVTGARNMIGIWNDKLVISNNLSPSSRKPVLQKKMGDYCSSVSGLDCRPEESFLCGIYYAFCDQ